MLFPIVFLLIFHSSFSFRESLVLFVYLTVLYTCCPFLYELKCVHGHHIRRHTELYDISDVFRWRNVAHFSNSYHDHCAISDILNIKQQTKGHQTSKERRHELVMMSSDVCKSLTPTCLFSAYQTEWSGYYLFLFLSKCSVVRYLRCYSDCRGDVIV